MKPIELRPLIGRMVTVYWNGLRTGKVVAAPATDIVTIKFLPPYGKRRITAGDLCEVWWRKKLMPVKDFLAMKALKSKPTASDTTP